MDEIMDTKVVQMKFDNSQFRAGVQDTIKQLDMLDDSLKLTGASDGLDRVVKASKSTTNAMADMSDAVNTVKVSFSALEVAGITAMVRLTNAAINYGQQISNALFGQIIQGGKQRSLNIENAKFQLRGLGVAWDDIKGDIEYGVQDTAYGLDSAARVASQLVASGVQLGDEMKSFLRGISGVAAMTNSSYDEIGHIFTTIASNGKLMTMQLRELSNRGLNASAVLAKAMGTTEQAVNEMVSQGKIGFKEFADAMDDAFGEHAKEANDTFQGVMSNVKSALSRIGAKFADPTFGALHDILDALRYDINNINNALDPVVSVFSRIANYAGNMLHRLLTSTNFMKGLQWLVVDIYSYLRPIGVALFEMTNIRFDVEAFGTTFMNFAKSLQLYGDKAMYVKDIIKSVFSGIDMFAYTVISVVKAFAPVGRLALDILGKIFGVTSDAPDMLWRINAPFKQLVDRITYFISLGLEKAINLIRIAISRIDWSKVINGLKAFIGFIYLAVKNIISFGKIIVTLFKIVGAAITIAKNALLTFIALVVAGFRWVSNYISGLGIFDGLVARTSVDIDTTPAEKSVETIEKAYQRTTETIEKTGTTAQRTAGKIEVASKSAAGSASKLGSTYDEAAESAKNMASDVEKSYDRVTKAAGGVPEPGKSITRQPSSVTPETINKPTDGLLNKTKTEPSSGGGTGFISTMLNNMGFTDRITTTIGNAIDSWYGGIHDFISSKAAYWFIKIYSKVQMWSPVLAVIGGAIVSLSTFIVPLITVLAVLKRLFGLIDGIITSLKAIGEAVNALKDYAKAEKFKAVAEVIRSIAIVLISIAASIAIIAVAALLIEKYDLMGTIKKIGVGVLAFTVLIGIFIIIIEALLAYKTFMIQLTKQLAIINRIGKPAPLERAPDTFTSVVDALTKMFIALAVDLGVLIVAAAVFANMDFWHELVPAIFAIGVLGMICIAMVAAMVGLGRTMGNQTSTLKGFDAKTKTWTDQVNSNGTVIHKAMLALAAYMAVIIAGVKTFGGMSVGELTKGMGFIVIAMAALGFFIKSVGNATSDLYKDKKKLNTSALNQMTTSLIGSSETTSKSTSDANSLNSIVKIIRAVSLYISALATTMFLLRKTPISTLVTLGIMMVACIGILGWVIKTIVAAVKELSDLDFATTSVGKIFDSINKLVLSISVMVLSMGVSLAIMSSVHPENMIQSFILMYVSLVTILGFITALTVAVAKADLGDALNQVGKSIMSISVSLSILMIAIGAMFAILGTVKWADMSGSFGYLLGTIVFIELITATIMALSTVAKSDAALWAAVGIFGALSVLLLSIGYMFTILSAVDWQALDTPVAIGSMLGTIALITVIIIFASVLTAAGEVALVALGAIAALSSMFISLGAMFLMIGASANLLGDGAEKIAKAISVIMSIPWDRAGAVIKGLGTLILGLVECMALMKLTALGGAISFAIVTGLIAFAIKQLVGIDPAQIKMTADALVTFFTTIAEGLDGKEDVMELISRFSGLIPLVANNLMIAALQLAVGGVGLVAFGFELVIFANLMMTAGQNIGPAFEMLVEGIMKGASAISENALALQVGMLVLASFGLLITAVGALLIAGGATMTIGTLLILAAGSMLDTAISMLVNALVNSGDIIFQNAQLIVGAVGLLTSFGLAMIPVGLALVTGGTLLTIGGGLMAVGSLLIYMSVKNFANAGVTLTKAGVIIVNNVRMIIAATKSALNEAGGLGSAAATAGVNIVQGFIAGISEAAPAMIASMGGLAGAGFEAFCAVLGIHSPATEMIEAGLNTVLGFVGGIVESTPIAAGVMEQLGIDSENAFTVDLTGDAEDGVTGFIQTMIAGFEEMFPDLNEVMTSLMDTVGYNGTSALLNQVSNGLTTMQNLFAEAGMLSPEQTAEYNRLLNAYGTAAAEGYRSGIKQNNYEAAYREYKEWNNPLDIGDFNFSSPYTSSLGGSDFGGATSDLASSISGSSGSGSGINDASKGSAIGTGGSTVTNNNNTYNFVQNNYSPEPLDRSEIYQQTKNQLSSWYNFNLEKNLAR